MARVIERLRQRKPMSLQLTSLLDMFTIILVFLMVSYQAEDKDFVLHAGLTLPASSAKSAFKPAVNVAITGAAVFVEGTPIYNLRPGAQLQERDVEARHIKSITRAITKAWDSLKKSEDKEENVVVIQSDQGIPYQTLHAVMRSAAFAGFFRFRLVVEKE